MTRARQIAWVLFKTAMFTVLAPFTVGIALPRYLHRAFLPPFDGVDYGVLYCSIWCTGTELVGPVFLVLGIIVYSWCAWDFAAKGMGTPAPIDAPKKLVVSGLYRFVRNPMYWGVFLLILSQAMMFYSLPILVYLVFVFLCFHLFIVFYEEPYLGKTFGVQYQEYRHNVRRWLPRLKPYNLPAT